jgi:hypothetical protein
MRLPLGARAARPANPSCRSISAVTPAASILILADLEPLEEVDGGAQGCGQAPKRRFAHRIPFGLCLRTQHLFYISFGFRFRARRSFRVPLGLRFSV